MARRIFRQPAVVMLLLFFSCLALYQMHRANTREQPKGRGLDIDRLPAEYQAENTQSRFCEERFGRNYLYNFRANSAIYCESDSFSQLECFSDQIDVENKRTDTFCVGGPAVWNPTQKQFGLQCRLRSMSPKDIDSGTIPFDRFTEYLYETGPRYIFQQFVEFFGSEKRKSHPALDAPIGVLVKRENVHLDPHHGLLEIMSTYLTLDTLRMTIDPARGIHMFTSFDFANTQIVILDDYEDGPYFDLWSLFAHRPVVRISELVAQPNPVVYRNIITPLPGASNPFWLSDSSIHNCHNSTLLSAFSSRVLHLYDIPLAATLPTPKTPNPIRLTYITTPTQPGTQIPSILTDLNQIFPPSLLSIDIVDYSTLSFPAQLNITHHYTDIFLSLQGPHLIQTIFLQPGSVVLEIAPFEHSDHVAFENLAGMMIDVGYRRIVGKGKEEEEVETGGVKDEDEDEDRDRDRRRTKRETRDGEVDVDRRELLEVLSEVIREVGGRKGLVL